MTAAKRDRPKTSLRSFNRIARAYRTLEYASFGRALERTREHYLPQLAGARRALVMGDGDGRFVAALLARNPGVRVVAVDASERMLELLAARCVASADRLTVRCGDLRAGAAELLETADGEPFDLVVTHFFLDCLTTAEVERLVCAVRPRLAPDARWVISEFRVPPAGHMRWIGWGLVRGLYAAFWLITGLRTSRLPEYETVLRSGGFVRLGRQLRLGGVLTAELWSPRDAVSSPATSVPFPAVLQSSKMNR